MISRLIILIAALAPAIAYAAPPLSTPWPCEVSYRITQGHNTGSHVDKGAWAWDIGVPQNADVVAPADGVVRAIRMDSNSGGCDSAYANDANYVVIDFGDGTEALLLHLAQNSSTLKVGEQVKRGQVVGRVGLTDGFAERICTSKFRTPVIPGGVRASLRILKLMATPRADRTCPIIAHPAKLWPHGMRQRWSTKKTPAVSKSGRRFGGRLPRGKQTIIITRSPRIRPNLKPWVSGSSMLPRLATTMSRSISHRPRPIPSARTTPFLTVQIRRRHGSIRHRIKAGLASVLTLCPSASVGM
jgi:hypothetical protein